MNIIETKLAGGSLKGGFGGPTCSSSGGSSILSPIARGPIHGGQLCRHSRPNANGAPRRRRVCFIDEVHGDSPQGLVTSTRFRPRTTREEKASLYYTSQDFRFFALEDYYYQLEMIQKCQPEQGLSWEDCMVYEGGFYTNETLYEENRCGGSPMHKVKTRYNLLC